MSFVRKMYEVPHKNPRVPRSIATLLHGICTHAFKKVWWDFENHNNRRCFFSSVVEQTWACKKLKALVFFNEEPPTLFMLQGREDDDRCPDLQDSFTAAHFPCLEELALPCAHLTGGNLRFDLPGLKILSVCGCWTHPRNDVLQFVNIAVRKSSQLRKLHVRFFEIDDKFFPRLAKSLGKNSRGMTLKVTRLCQFKHFQLLSDMACCKPGRDKSHDLCPDYMEFLNKQACKAGLRVNFEFDTVCCCVENGPCPCGVS